MAQQRKDKGPATNVACEGWQGERPEKVAPVECAVKYQIKDFNGSDNNVRGIGECDKPVIRIITTIFALPAEGNIHTIVAMIQPEIMALENISTGVFFITSMPIFTNASRVGSSNIGIYSNARGGYTRTDEVPQQHDAPQAHQ